MLAVHAAARAVTAVLLLVVAERQAENLWTPASPSYPQYTGLMWDASWYRTIAEQGYPAELPLGEDGRVQQNAWAFFPLYPALVRLVTVLTGQPWQVAAPTLSLVLGAAAMLAVHRAVSLGLASPALPVPGRVVPGGAAGSGGGARLPEGVRRHVPLVTVAVLTTGAAAPVLQVAYTESLALLLLACALWCVMRRRYLLAVPVVLALGLTRAVALPLTVAVLAHGWARWREQRGAGPGGAGPGGAWAPGEPLRLGVLAAAAGLSGVLWPAVVALATGRADAYPATQAAWRGTGDVVPLVPWVQVGQWLLGPWAVPALVVVALGLVALLLSPPLARLGAALHGWTAGYLAYLVLVLEPGTSLVRFGLLAFPVAGVVAQLCLRARWPRSAVAVVVLLGLLAQLLWLDELWRLVPPSGWPP
ncbi:hypothetical protein [Actinotalea sp. JY-7876]|uniref:hypothetical protein n=1 Tax=Actinotalea sp. JY-7876 TaxID=2758442 RepID=UPI0015F559DB|nr:hypothetical protein [Actinotalea sp. JY-7876]